jgi:adenylosuccinate lyase
MRSYQSPFTERYGKGSDIWSEEHKRQLWRMGWIELLEQQSESGLIPLFVGQQQWLREYKPKTYTRADLAQAKEREKTTHHDVVAELECFAVTLPDWLSQYIHLGATSSDIEDYADRIQILEHLFILDSQLIEVGKD